MKKVLIRIVYTLVAVFIAVVIVATLSTGGNSSKGPIENIMANIGDFFDNMEHKWIMHDRTNKRESKLKWLQPYFKDKNLLVHPGKILLGVFDNDTKENFECIVNLEDTLKTTF